MIALRNYRSLRTRLTYLAAVCVFVGFALNAWIQRLESSETTLNAKSEQFGTEMRLEQMDYELASATRLIQRGFAPQDNPNDQLDTGAQRMQADVEYYEAWDSTCVQYAMSLISFVENDPRQTMIAAQASRYLEQCNEFTPKIQAMSRWTNDLVAAARIKDTQTITHLAGTRPDSNAIETGLNSVFTGLGLLVGSAAAGAINRMNYIDVWSPIVEIVSIGIFLLGWIFGLALQLAEIAAPDRKSGADLRPDDHPTAV